MRCSCARPRSGLSRTAIVAAWATFSALYSLSSIIPILVNLQGYLQELAEVRMMGEEYVNAYLKYYGNAEWIVFIVALTAFAGFLGASWASV